MSASAETSPFHRTCPFLAPLLLIFFLWLPGLACSAEYPAAWPWRGVAINYPGYNDDPALITQLAKSNVNAVELVLSVRDVARFRNMTPQAAWDSTLQWADRMLDACRENGIVAILTFVQIPIDPALGLTETSFEFWHNPELQAEAVRLAGAIATRFKMRGKELAAYEILSEPVLRISFGPQNPTAWPVLRQRIVEKIRSVDPERFIVVTAGLGAEAKEYRSFKPLPQKRIVYGAHFYIPHAFTHQSLYEYSASSEWPGMVNSTYWNKEALRRALQPLADFKQKYDVPVWIGEFSAIRWAKGGNQWIKDAVSVFDASGFGWAYWVLNGWHGWDPFFDTHHSTDDVRDYKTHYVGPDAERWKIIKQLLSTR